jgi:elongation factor P
VIPAAELRAGTAFRHGGELLLATEAEYRVAAGKFGSLVFVKAKALKTGHLKELRFHPDDKVEDVELERRQMEYLYSDGDSFTFMDPENFEQVSLAKAAIAPLDRFLRPGMKIPVEFDQGEPVRVVFPEAVELAVVTAPPGLKEHEGTPFKTVVLENGMEILAPQFIKEGDRVRVEVATGKYLERVRRDARKL